MRLVDRLLSREPESAPPAPDDAAAEAAQREAERLRKTAQELGEIDPSAERYW